MEKELRNSFIVSVMSAIENDRPIVDNTEELYAFFAELRIGDKLVIVEDEA